MLAVDLGGTKVEAAIVDSTGTIAPGSRTRAATGPASDAASLRAAVRSVVAGALSATGPTTPIAGVGIGSAGPIDTARRTISPLNLPGAAGFPLADAVRDALPAGLRDTPIRFALDGLCIVMAEHRWGAGRGVDTMLGMVVSTGIGGGVIAGGAPYPSATGNAGHLGQIEVAGFAGPDVRGLEATVERIASGPNIVRWAQGQGWRGATGEDLAAGYATGDKLAVAAVRRSAAAVGSALASASALLDLDLVVIGGGFSHVSEDYIDLVRAARDATAAYPFLARADITRAQLGGDSPLRGAAALALAPSG